MADLQIEHAEFPERESRTRFVAKRFANYLQDTILDVGCYEAPLRKILEGVEYTGVDFVGDPDIQLNLEQCTELPFEPDSFSCVLCIDVLEHLNNLHVMFDELIRVSNKYIIIALPNCWRDARRPIERGKGDFGHYGLDVNPPPDRHKWFFSFTQAKNFIEGQAERHKLSVVEMFGTEKRKAAPIQFARKIRYPGNRYNNRYVTTIWAVYEKKHIK